MRVSSEDAEISYEVLGSGPALVVLHAFPVNRQMWRPAAEVLASRYRVIMPDLRGHCDSTFGTGPATMDKHAADVARVCDDAGVGRAFFAGNSIGGYVLFEFWRRFRERVAGLVLCDTRAPADSDEIRMNRLKSIDDVRRFGPEPFVEKMLERLLGATTRSSRPDVVAQTRAMAMRMTVAGITAIQQGMAERLDSRPTLPTIQVPTLLLFGEEDVVSPRADAELLRAGISNSRLHMIPKAGHLAPFEQPEEVAALMRGFMEANAQVQG